jgi:hypothetical protein|tara:strand:+ start:117 stop:305 length:189 start_codon:yes stop_codon:yes gene_type:complete
MIRSIVLCMCFILFTGCSSIGELVLNTAAGALGNMLDRRVDEPTENEKENDDECEDCKDDKR